jgi:hypothetical protein
VFKWDLLLSDFVQSNTVTKVYEQGIRQMNFGVGGNFVPRRLDVDASSNRKLISIFGKAAPRVLDFAKQAKKGISAKAQRLFLSSERQAVDAPGKRRVDLAKLLP